MRRPVGTVQNVMVRISSASDSSGCLTRTSRLLGEIMRIRRAIRAVIVVAAVIVMVPSITSATTPTPGVTPTPTNTATHHATFTPSPTQCVNLGIDRALIIDKTDCETTGCLDVVAADTCCWEAAGRSGNVEITSRSSGCGNGTVCYRAEWGGCDMFPVCLDGDVGGWGFTICFEIPTPVLGPWTPTPTPTPTCPPLPPFQCLPDYEKVCGTTDGCTTCQCVLKATPTATPTPPPSVSCQPAVGLTDCEAHSDCVVVNQIDCCPCSSGGHQAAINQSRQADLSRQVEACCAAAGACLPVYQCEENLGAICQSGTCALINTAWTPTPTPTPTGVIIGIGDFCEPDRICPPGLLCLIDPPHQALVCSCVGDCDGNAEVTVDELVTLVNVALGNTAASVCPLGDANEDGQIDISEILQAVNNALHGCGAIPARTPTAVPTPMCLASGEDCSASADCCSGACVAFDFGGINLACE